MFRVRPFVSEALQPSPPARKHCPQQHKAMHSPGEAQQAVPMSLGSSEADSKRLLSGTLSLKRFFARIPKMVVVEGGKVAIYPTALREEPLRSPKAEIVELTPDCVVETFAKQPRKIVLSTRAGKFVFEASNAAEGEQWVQAFRQAIPDEPKKRPRGNDRTVTSRMTSEGCDSSIGSAAPTVSYRTHDMHEVQLLGDIFLIDKRWMDPAPIAVGATGRVAMAVDRFDTERRVAIKKIASAFRDVVDMKRFLRELRYLTALSHPNIVQKVDVTIGHVHGVPRDMYIVTEWMQSDLHKLIHGQHKIRFTHDQVVFVTYQIFCALNYLHSANVIHRDIKPGNILIDRYCHVKLCDFGLSTAIAMDGAEFKTEYVVTRYYRAPEIILSAGAYDERIDVWGAACVVGEMILGGILFPSKSYMHQLDLMISLLGKPTDPELEFVRKPRALTYMKNLAPAPRQPFHLVFPGASPALLQLLEGCLQFSPDYRARVDQVLALELFNEVRSPQAEARAPGPVHIEDIENTPLVREDLLDMMLREGAAFTRYSNEASASMAST